MTQQYTPLFLSSFKWLSVDRSSRVQTSNVDYQSGHFVEIPGRLTHRGQYKMTTTSTTTPAPTTRRYKKPELKSLGTPDQPTKSSTAIQLEATAGGHWRLSRWAMRMNADTGFPVTQDGRVGVPSPGLYLVYAQVSSALTLYTLDNRKPQANPVTRPFFYGHDRSYNKFLVVFDLSRPFSWYHNHFLDIYFLILRVWECCK